MNPMRTLRDDLGWSQKRLGDALDVSQTRISEMERGQPIGRDLGLRLYDQFRVRLSRLGISLETLMRWGGNQDEAA